MMHRLFVALRPPAAIRAALIALMGGVPGARWQDDDQLHLTLRFIGEVDRHMASDIAAVLGSIAFAPFDLSLDGAGQFERRERIDTLWVGVRPHDQVAALHRKVDQALQKVGLAPDSRTYVPHITVARFGRAAGTISPFVDGSGSLAGLHFPVTHFGLFESTLGHDGPNYTLVERYALR